ncbi:MAG: thrombospondin type 3 repeat-containing protein, partial [Myxococcota bacterium]|nr:thrombospondin type 3 repeat-containing protein [Myxococcota bacterium]
PDSCRSTCRSPRCGDGVTDSQEECDDGNGLGGDGCSPRCVLESETGETEPNDSWATAQPIGEDWVSGALTTGDVDCFSIAVSECHTVIAETGGDCRVPLVLALHAADGTQVASSGFDDRGCSVVDPVEEPGARFVAEGDWAVCVTPLMDEQVASYSVRFRSDSSESFDLPASTTSDSDGDGLIDDCDSDRDGDGIPNLEDNCPNLANGPDNPSSWVDESGFVRHWLALGPFVGHSSENSCLPTTVERLGIDAEAVPEVGVSVEGQRWRVFVSDSAHIDLVSDFASVDAPREVYLASWLFSPTARNVTLAHGPDDGARVWLNGVVVQEVSGCQGASADKFTENVTLLQGWNRLLVKVYDQGGGWGTYLRFLDGQEPLTDLEVSLTDGEAWGFDQSDSDGDGVGDACDWD